MARLLAALAALAALICSPAAAEFPEPGRTYVVAFAQDTMANDWRAAQVRDVRRALAGHPEVRFVHSDAGGSMARQVLDIETFAAQGVDVLITSPLDPVAMAPVLAAVHAKGIPVILLSRRVEGDAYTSFVGADNRAIARRAGVFLAERLGGRGRILMLQHIPTTTPAIQRTEGFLEGIAGHPEVEVVAILRGDSLRAKALRAVEQALASGLRFDAIYAQSDSMAAGARMALRGRGIDPATVPTVGIDYIAEAREAIRAGEQAASFTYPTFGKEGAELAMRLLRGQTVPREVIAESVMVTRDNVDAVEPIF